MDRKYIEAEHIVDRYLSGDLTVREAREFEQYCHDHPDALKAMPIPVRLKARLSRRPAQDSETGVFKAIPSSATHAALEASDEGFDVEEEQREYSRGQGVGGNRAVFIGLVFALVAAVAGVIAYAVQANSLSKQVKEMQARRDARCKCRRRGARRTIACSWSRRQAGGSRRSHLGWMQPPQWLDLYIDVSEGKYNQFMITHREGRRRAGHAAAARGARLESRAAPGAQLVGVRARAITCSRSTATTGAGRRKKSAGCASSGAAVDSSLSLPFVSVAIGG